MPGMKIPPGARVWFTGCTHFGHTWRIEADRLPFKDVADMDYCLTERWNAWVRPDDLVFHLGDFANQRPESYLPRLNGKVIFLQGDHDKAKIAGVRTKPYLEIQIGTQKYVLCHYPIDDWRGRACGTIHIHAHTHLWARRSAPRRVNVCSGAWNHAPVALDEIHSTCTA